MRRGNRTNALVVELMIAVLFFMLASVILARVFAYAHNQGVRAQLLTQALAEAQNTADRVYAAQSLAAFLKADGFDEAGEPGGYRKNVEDLTVEVVVQPSPVRDCIVYVRKDGELLVKLPCSRYMAETEEPESEVAP